MELDLRLFVHSQHECSGDLRAHLQRKQGLDMDRYGDAACRTGRDQSCRDLDGDRAGHADHTFSRHYLPHKRLLPDWDNELLYVVLRRMADNIRQRHGWSELLLCFHGWFPKQRGGEWVRAVY